jgi:Tol biopolymer transport system component
VKRDLLILIMLLSISAACSPKKVSPPVPIPPGILLGEIPPYMDIIFDSIRYVLNDEACLDDFNLVDESFINLPGCNSLIYDPEEGGLASQRQLFAMDIETGEVLQITNTDCAHILGQEVDPSRIMTLAICEDTDKNGVVNENDKSDIYLLDLPSTALNCLTCDLDLNSINNPDFSPINQMIVFSAQRGSEFHNYLFTIDLEKNLTQITHQENFMDFDCSWSEDGSLVVFNRLPSPWFSLPSQIWLMAADGTDQVQITQGGPDLGGEGFHGVYPIGIDADPDLSPDNQKIVFSRLKTGLTNQPFGVFELLVADIDTGEIEVLDSNYANMIPQWKSRGILINRQVGILNGGKIKAMELKQSLYLYKDGTFKELESYPYNVFPIGAYGGYWIELE